MTRNVRVRGGKPVQFARSLPRCWKACLSHVACRGFDYVTSRQVSPLGNIRCFLHGQQSICNPYEHMPGFDNYRFHVCGASSFACLNIFFTNVMLLTYYMFYHLFSLNNINLKLGNVHVNNVMSVRVTSFVAVFGCFGYLLKARLIEV